jgi:16S rRNA (guanine966-N2)-methyltransferase
MSRIIAGSHRGRQLVVPTHGKTRPTTDRVREALFSAVTSWAGTSALPPEESLRGLSFCDLYAGSGAVGLEAASRGAAPVLLVEGDRRTAQTAGKNVESLGLPARVRTSRVEPLVRSPGELAFDVVFADPPYDLDATSLEAVLVAVVEQGWVAPDGLIVVERSRRTPELGWPVGFRDTWARRYGETTLIFARGEPAGADGRSAAAEKADPTSALPVPPSPTA